MFAPGPADRNAERVREAIRPARLPVSSLSKRIARELRHCGAGQGAESVLDCLDQPDPAALLPRFRSPSDIRLLSPAIASAVPYFQRFGFSAPPRDRRCHWAGNVRSAAAIQ